MVEKLRILGKTYQVQEVEPAGLDNQGCIGEHCPKELKIWIRKGLAPDQARETLLHEAVHGLDVALCTHLTEEQVCALSTGLFAMARESPEAVKYMLGL